MYDGEIHLSFRELAWFFIPMVLKMSGRHFPGREGMLGDYPSLGYGSLLVSELRSGMRLKASASRQACKHNRYHKVMGSHNIRSLGSKCCSYIS